MVLNSNSTRPRFWAAPYGGRTAGGPVGISDTAVQVDELISLDRGFRYRVIFQVNFT
jgi:hypothetical protein